MAQSHLHTLPLYSVYASPNIAVNALSSGLIWKRLMYSTNATGPTSTQAEDRNIAHAMSINKTLRYIGLRENL